MSVTVDKGGLKVDARLINLVKDEIAPGTGVDPDHFWSGLGKIVIENAPANKALLDKRDNLQRQINDYHTPRKVVALCPYIPTVYVDVGGWV